MEDLRNQDVDFKSIHVPTSDSFTIIINDKSYRLSESQFIQIHNDITTTLTQKLMKERGLL